MFSESFIIVFDHFKGESILHIACENGLHRLVKILLEKGSDPNVQTRLTVSHGNFQFELF